MRLGSVLHKRITRFWGPAIVLLLAGIPRAEGQCEDCSCDVVVLKNLQKVLGQVERRAVRDESDNIKITNLDGKTIEKSHKDIKEIRYRENCLIGKLRKLVDERNFEELPTFVVDLRFLRKECEEGGMQTSGETPIRWDTFDELQADIDILAAEQDEKEGRAAEANAKLDTLFAARRASPKVREVFERIYRARADSALKTGGYADAQKSISELQMRYPNNLALAAIGKEIEIEIQRLIRDAQSSENSGIIDAAQRSLRLALRINPTHAQLQERVRKFEATYRILNCGLIGGTAEPEPLSRRSYIDNAIARLCFRSLFDRRWEPPDDLHARYTGDLAGAWTLSDDGITLRIVLKPDVVWSDGRSITAQDVVYTLGLLTDPQSRWYDIRLASSLKEATSSTPTTLVLRFRIQPASALDLLCFPVLPEQRGEQHLMDVSQQPYVVSGPFSRCSFDGERLLMRRREPYDAGSPAAITALSLRFYGNCEQAISSLLSGDLQLLGGLTSRRAKSVEETNSAFRIGRTRIQALHFLALKQEFFSTTENDGRNLRRALADAVDRQGTLERIIGGPAARGVFPAACLPADPDNDLGAWPFDPEAAKDTLGRLFRGTVPAISFVFSREGVSGEVCPRLVDNLKAAGWKTVVNACSEVEFRRRVYGQHDFDVAYASYLFTDEFCDASPLFEIDNPENIMEVRNERLSKAAGKLRGSIDRSRVVNSMREWETTAISQRFLIPLWHIDDLFIFSTRLGGIEDDPEWLFEGLERWTLKPEVD